MIYPSAFGFLLLEGQSGGEDSELQNTKSLIVFAFKTLTSYIPTPILSKRTFSTQLLKVKISDMWRRGWIFPGDPARGCGAIGWERRLVLGWCRLAGGRSAKRDSLAPSRSLSLHGWALWQLPKPLADLFSPQTVHLSGNEIGYRRVFFFFALCQKNLADEMEFIPAFWSRKVVLTPCAWECLYLKKKKKARFLLIFKDFWKLLTHSHPIWM